MRKLIKNKSKIKKEKTKTKNQKELKMKVWIIYDNKFETTKRYCVDAMLDAAKRHNVDAEVLFPIYFTSVFENGKVKLLYKNKVIDNLPDYVLFRIYDNELLQTFEKLGVKIINGGMMQSKNKYISTIFASHLNMNIPKTIYTKNYDYGQHFYYERQLWCKRQ